MKNRGSAKKGHRRKNRQKEKKPCRCNDRTEGDARQRGRTKRCDGQCRGLIMVMGKKKRLPGILYTWGKGGERNDYNAN